MSKAAGGVLATSLGELHATTPAAASAGGHQETIRALLREQKHECAALHAYALFREFRDKQRHMKNNAVAVEGPAPVIDDLEAEGQSRLLDVIRAAAADRQAEPAGVWASFGKPYQCLGELQQLEDCRVPQLYRDELQQRRPQQQQSQQQQQRAAGAQAAAAGSFAAAAGGAAKKAVRAVASQRQSAEGCSHAPGSGSREAEEAARLLRHKTVMQFSTVDRLEAAFPAAVVKQAEARRKATMSRPNAFFNGSKAAADAADPAGSYGRHQLPFKQLPALELVQHHQAATMSASLCAEQPAVRRGTTAATGGDPSSVFITQRADTGGKGIAIGESPATAGHGRGTKSRHKALAAKRASAAVPTFTSECQLLPGAGATTGATACAAEASSASFASSSSTSASSSYHNKQPGSQQQQQQQQPVFKPLTELALQAPGGNSRLTDWHNDFVKVRHAGYTSLQACLWQRSQDRAAARADPAAAGQLQRLMGMRLDAVSGQMAPGWTPGVVPESPFAAGAAGTKQRSSVAAATADNAAGGGNRAIKVSEVELLEHFYEALCSLVERQRLSDPLSLLVVHKVKALLEGGTFLQPALLQQVIDGVAEFVVSCGLLRHNRFALPLLTFIGKCAGVSQHDFGAMVAAAGITAVLYKPSAAAAEAAAQQAAVSGSPAAASAAGPAGSAEQQQQAGSRSASMSRCSTRGRGSMREAAAGVDSSNNSGQRIASAAGAQQHQACTAAAVPSIHIDAAAAVASADIDQAVHSAPASHRTIAINAGGAKSMRVRVQGVAGEIELPQQQSPVGAAAAAAGARPGSSTGGGCVAAATGAAVAATEDDEPLPELGADEAGQPLSRRLRHREGLQDWASQQAAAVKSRTAGGDEEANDDEQEGDL